jgi:two-component system response regulator HydG
MQTQRSVLLVSLGVPIRDITDHLRSGGWGVHTADDWASAKRIGLRQQVQVGVLMFDDIDSSTLEILEAYLKQLPQVEWVGVLQTDALKSAELRDLVLSHFFDYHTQPVDWRVLNLTLGHAFRRAQLRGRSDPPIHKPDLMGMVGTSPAMMQLRQQISKVSATRAPVLIGGESGSGKELAARAIHRCSAQADGPFVEINCGAIAPSLIHSELFGFERGAFTGASVAKRGLIESANGGTLFLDEIADLPLELQTNLLRFLQEHTIARIGSTRIVSVDARVVAASHVDLTQAVEAGRFREDLYYRLNVLPIVVPPLRERMEDVVPLAKNFLQSCLPSGPRRGEGFSREASMAMLSHAWPGNVRELHNRVQRAVVMTDHRLITPIDLGLSDQASCTAAISASGAGLDAVRTTAERELIVLTLDRVGRNVTHAARELGVSRMTLYRLIDKHGLNSGTRLPKEIQNAQQIDAY